MRLVFVEKVLEYVNSGCKLVISNVPSTPWKQINKRNPNDKYL